MDCVTRLRPEPRIFRGTIPLVFALMGAEGGRGMVGAEEEKYP